MPTQKRFTCSNIPIEELQSTPLQYFSTQLFQWQFNKGVALMEEIDLLCQVHRYNFNLHNTSSLGIQAHSYEAATRYLSSIYVSFFQHEFMDKYFLKSPRDSASLSSAAKQWQHLESKIQPKQPRHESSFRFGIATNIFCSQTDYQINIDLCQNCAEQTMLDPHETAMIIDVSIFSLVCTFRDKISSTIHYCCVNAVNDFNPMATILKP